MAWHVTRLCPAKGDRGESHLSTGGEQLPGVRRARGTGEGRGGAPTSTWSAGAEERPDGEDAQAVGEEGGEEARRRRARHGHAARESGIMRRGKRQLWLGCGFGAWRRGETGGSPAPFVALFFCRAFF